MWGNFSLVLGLLVCCQQHTRCAERVHTPPRRCCVVSDNVSYEIPELILDPDPDQRQNFISSRRSPLAHAYHDRSTSVNAFESYRAHRVMDRQTDRQWSHSSALVQWQQQFGHEQPWLRCWMFDSCVSHWSCQESLVIRPQLIYYSGKWVSFGWLSCPNLGAWITFKDIFLSILCYEVCR